MTELRTNRDIRCREVRLVDDTGAQMGVMSPWDALKIAEERGLDLVEVAPSARPPTCKLLDYGKYRYEQAKKVKTQKSFDTKIIQVGVATGSHDWEHKVKSATEFLSKGHRVKWICKMRGREIAQSDLHLKTFADALLALKVGSISQPPTIEGRDITAIWDPKPSKE